MKNKENDKTNDYVNKLDDSDLKVLNEVKSIVEMFKKPFWKFVLGIIIVSSLLNICYILGYVVGQILSKI